MKPYPCLRGLAAGALLLLFAFSARAQQIDTALIVGTVTDASGAVIPGVNISFRHVATGTVYTTQTNEEGRYRSQPLRIGEYEVSAEAPGFKKYTGSGVVLSIGDVRQLDITLELGAVTETIEVQASAPLLQTSDATAGTVIENRQIVDLPLNGRNYLQLALISSGTVRSRGQGVSIGGARGTEVNFVIDGMDNNNQSIASQGRQKEVVKPSIDAIAEFKVVTNGFSAEYGKTSSGVINLSIKSGTNEIHGTVFEFLRNDKFAAKNFFDPPEAEKPPFKRNQYGFAVGGPIKKNTAFIFGDIEWTDRRESATRNVPVPSVAQRQGDFTGEDIIYDPLTWDGTERQPFPNNVIPKSRFDPVATYIKDWYPDPNSPDGRFRWNPPRNQDHYKWDVRYDHNLSARNNFFLRWSSQQQNVAGVPALPPTEFGSLTGGGPVDVTSNNAVASFNRIWSPNLISNFRFGWNYIDTDNTVHSDVTGDVNGPIGLKGYEEYAHLPGAAMFSISTYRSVGSSNWRPNLIQSQTRQLSADTTWTKGNHAVKFGMTIYWLQSFIKNPQRAKGTWYFDGRFTERSPKKRKGTGEPFADLLLGAAREVAGSNTVYMNLRAPFEHFYIQDDWKVTSKLTLNLGLRYEYNAPWVETRDLISNFRLGTCRGCDDGYIEVAGTNGSDRRSRALIDPDRNNFAPRVGLAYRVFDKTVIRAAYGIFYSNVTNTGGGEYMETNPPFHLKASLTTDRITPLYLRDGLPPGAISPERARGIEVSYFEGDPPWPMSQAWNFNIQQALPADMLFEIGYFGDKANHVVWRTDINKPPPGPGNINDRRPWRHLVFPGTDNVVTLGRMNAHSNNGNLLYHGLHMKLEKRYSQGMTLIVTYQWSKAISDYTPLPGTGRAPGEDGRRVQDPLNLRNERGPSAQDQRHRFVGAWVYELPFGRGKRWGQGWSKPLDAVVGGWSIGGILSLLSGTPVNLTVRGNPSNTGGGDRPNVVGDWRLSRSERTLDRFFNTDAFVPNDPYTYGNAGRNVLVMPGRVNLDASLYKTISFTERYRLQLRFEAFGATNTPQFGPPNAQVGNKYFGKITSAGGWRNLQFGLKFIF